MLVRKPEWMGPLQKCLVLINEIDVIALEAVQVVSFHLSLVTSVVLAMFHTCVLCLICDWVIWNFRHCYVILGYALCIWF
jgi:hypothetical protein